MQQNLTKLNNCNRIFNLNPLKALENYALWVTLYDKKLNAENLTSIEARYVLDFCFDRGINANNITIKQAIKQVQSRLEFSELLSKTTDHSKVFLVYDKEFLNLLKICIKNISG